MWKIFVFLQLFCLLFHQTTAFVEYNVTHDLAKTITPITEDGKTIYKIEENKLYHVDISKQANGGELTHSFECTFRLNPKEVTEETRFNFIHLQNHDRSFHLYIDINLKTELIKFVLKIHSKKTVYNFHFMKNETNLLDGNWHNIMYGIHNFKHEDKSVDLWVDCNKHKYHVINSEKFSDKHTSYWLKNAILTVGEKHGERNESIPIEISKMRFHGYTLMPLFAKCEDFKNTTLTHKEEDKKAKVYVFHHKEHHEHDELDYDLDLTKSEEASDFWSSESNYTVHKIEDVTHEDDEDEPKFNPIFSVLGFLLFVSLISAFVYLFLKFY